MLVLQKFLAVREMGLFVCLVCEGEVKVKKWSLMSLTIMPDCVLPLGVFVSMWSMSEWWLFCILVALVMSCKNPLLSIVS